MFDGQRVMRRGRGERDAARAGLTESQPGGYLKRSSCRSGRSAEKYWDAVMARLEEIARLITPEP